MVKKNIQTASSSGWLANINNQCLVVVGIGVLIYLNTLNHGFVLDDQAVISQNKFVQQGISAWGNIFTTFYWKGFWNENAGLFRPLSLLMFSLEWQLLPGNPLVHHLIHIVTYGVLLWSLFRWLYELIGNKYPFIPFLALLLFATHPMHTEVVANIKSRDEILALLFFSWSAWFLLKDITAPSPDKKVISLILFFMALLSKEGAILFLPVMFIMLWFMKELTWLQSLKKLIPYLVVILVWGVWYFLVIFLSEDKVPEYTYLDNSLVAAPDYIHRLSTATGMVGKYIYLMVWPFNFSYDYSFNQIPVIGPVSVLFILSFLLVMGAFAAAYRSYKDKPIITFSILFFFITLALASNVFKIIGVTFAERLLFAPSLGFCILVSFIMNDWLNKKNQTVNTALLVLFAAISLGYSIVVVKRNKDWKSNFTLYKKDAQSATNSSRVHYNYASLLLNDVIPSTTDEKSKEKYLSEVIRELHQSIKIDSQYSPSYINLGVAYYKTKNYQASVNATRKALTLTPDDLGAIANLGDVYFKTGLFDSSIACHQKCIEKNYILKETYNFLGNAWFNKKDYKTASYFFHEGIKRDSLYATLWTNYGNALAMNKEYESAIHAYDRSYLIDPSNAETLYFKALTYHHMGDTSNARKWEEEFKRRK